MKLALTALGNHDGKEPWVYYMPNLNLSDPQIRMILSDPQILVILRYILCAQVYNSKNGSRRQCPKCLNLGRGWN